MAAIIRGPATAMTLLMLVLAAPAMAQAPHLRDQGDTRQLIVDGEPFLILGGELGNSAASDPGHLSDQWPTIEALNLNTVLAPVYWELIEPDEGRFDFASVDGLIEQARAHDMRLVLLWFGSWKNSMSSYVPGWVKRDQDRFPRARSAEGVAQEILSPFGAANREADRRAFAALMGHLARTDPQHTVIMVQVENEIGMLPDARDHAPGADAAFAAAVPDALLDYMRRNRAGLHPRLAALWRAQGSPSSGTWTEVFGPGDAAEEVFMAWSFGRYVEAIAAAGRTEHDLPLFVNAALNDPGVRPGGYPSAGPLPHLFDVWKAAAPSIDFLAPDIYRPNFTERIAAFRRADNPVFVPEANRAGRAESSADALWAIGHLDAMGFSPFAIETTDAATDPLAQTYAGLAELAPLILAHQGGRTLDGFRAPVNAEGEVDDSPRTVTLGGFDFTVAFVDPWTPRDRQNTAAHGGLIIQLDDEEFLVAGTGVTLTFALAEGSDTRVGIDRIHEGRFVDGVWTPGRLLNGDESHQGRHLRLPPGDFGIQRVRLYTYR
jgi:beta-galactosidase GanA